MEDVKEPKDSTPETGLVVMNVTDAAIAKFKEDYLGLSVNGIDDKAGLKAVYEARQIVKKTRVDASKFAKGLKEKALDWQRKVTAEEKRVVAELESIEAHLQSEEDKIEAEKHRIKQEAIDAENKRIQERIDKLAKFNLAVDFTALKMLDDESFTKVLAVAETKYKAELEEKAEAKRLADEAAAKLEADRKELEELRKKQLEAQRIIDENNARIAAEQKAKQDAIDAENRKIQAEKDELQRQQDLEKARQEAAEKARKQAVADHERIMAKAMADAQKAEDDRLKAEENAKIEAGRQAALRPDKEKLEAFAKKMGHAIDFEVKDPKAQLILNDISTMIGKMQIHILKKVKEL